MNTMSPDKGSAQSPEESFLHAFDTYNEPLFRHAELRVNNREKAIDIVHDTFTKAWSYIRTGHRIDSYRPFLYKILNNLIIDEYRKRKEASLDQLFAVDGVDEGTFTELVDDVSVDALVDHIDGAQALALLSDLPDQYREVLILRFVDGLGPKEISELIEISENVVSVRLHRALKTLRDLVRSKEEK